MENDEIIKRIGRKIKEVRQREMRTRRNVALKIDSDETYLRRIENGGANPTLKYLLKISQELGVDILEFFQPPREEQ